MNIAETGNSSHIHDAAWLLALGAILLGLSAPASAQTATPQGVMQSIAIDPDDAANVYTSGNGNFYRSADYGQTWTESSNALITWSLAIHPSDLDTVVEPDAEYVIYAATVDAGVWRSNDFGQTWTNDPNFSEEARSVVAHPDGTTVYAGTETGIYVSHDRGVSWQVLSDQLGPGQTQGLVIDHSNPNTLYAARWGQGVYRSTDAGVTWELGNDGLFDRQIFDLDMHPTNPSLLYASTFSGIFESSDAGTTWALLSTPSRTSELAFHPFDPSRMYASTEDSGIYRSLDGGQTWTAINDGLDGVQTFVSIAVAPNGLTGRVYAGSLNAGLFLSDDGGDTWSVVGSPEPAPPPSPPPQPSDGTYLSADIIDLQNGGSVPSGSDAVFRVILTNDGELTARNARFFASWTHVRILGTDSMPRTVTTSQGSCDSRGSCSLGNIPVGGSVELNIRGATKPQVLGWYKLTVRYEAENTSEATRTLELGSSVTVASSESGGGATGYGLLLLLLGVATCRRLRLDGNRPQA